MNGINNLCLFYVLLVIFFIQQLKFYFKKEGFLKLMSKYNKQYSLTQEFVKKGEIV
jgi:hypothetical protein